MMNSLALLKLNLGISSTARDSYLEQILMSSRKEIEAKGFLLSKSVDDAMLLCDYAAWRYRSRSEDGPVPQNIMIRIRERQIRERSKYTE